MSGENNTAPEQLDWLDALLDEENNDPIIITDTTGRQIKFEQVALIPFYGMDDEIEDEDDGKLYVLLMPVDEIPGVGENEAICFRIDEGEDGNALLVVEEDELIAGFIFDKFLELVEEDTEADEGEE